MKTIQRIFDFFSILLVGGIVILLANSYHVFDIKHYKQDGVYSVVGAEGRYTIYCFDPKTKEKFDFALAGPVRIFYDLGDGESPYLEQGLLFGKVRYTDAIVHFREKDLYKEQLR